MNLIMSRNIHLITTWYLDNLRELHGVVKEYKVRMKKYFHITTSMYLVAKHRIYMVF